MKYDNFDLIKNLFWRWNVVTLKNMLKKKFWIGDTIYIYFSWKKSNNIDEWLLTSKASSDSFWHLAYVIGFENKGQSCAFLYPQPRTVYVLSAYVVVAYNLLLSSIVELHTQQKPFCSALLRHGLPQNSGFAQANHTFTASG